MTRYLEEDGILYQIYEKDGKEYKRKYVDNKKYNNRYLERDIYKVWRYMTKRCEAKSGEYSRYYYKKGIRVCDEWRNRSDGFDNFYEWAIDNGYQIGLSIDRIDSNENYCPENCRWLTLEENRRLGLSQKHAPKWEYRAYNEAEGILLIFHKIDEFTGYCGIDSRRVSDGCKDSNYRYKGWKFCRRAINLDYYGSQETIPSGSTLEDELPTEVRIIHLPIKKDEDIVHSA